MYGDLGVHTPKITKESKKNNFTTFLPHGVELMENDNYMELLKKGLLELFSDERVLEYSKEKKINNIDDCSKFFISSSKLQLESLSYNYYIINTKFNMFCGIIINISYLGIEKYYPHVTEYIDNLKKSWFLEFYLLPQLWGKNWMRYYLVQMVNIHTEQGYKYFFCLVHIDHLRCQKFLEAKEFVRVGGFIDDKGRLLYKLKL